MAKRKNQKRSNKKYQVNNRRVRANHQYKDTVFRMLYRDKANLLSLYNAVNDRNYTNPEELQIVTLENAIYMGMKNDLAFIMDMNLYLYEHQSTYNPNIPLRMNISGLLFKNHYIRLQYRRYRHQDLSCFTMEQRK